MTMALDKALEAAIKQAVEEEGQPSAVGARIIAWLDVLSEGEVSPEQQDAYYARMIGSVNAGEPDED
jgi:hypothetical protein